MKRVNYYDVLKFWAIFVIAFAHFVGHFHPDYFVYYDVRPYSFVINGITGKMSVALLGVIMCSIAYSYSKKNPVDYFFNRYCYFVLTGTLVNILYMATGIYSENVSAMHFLQICLSLSDEIFPTFWCMKDFLFASTIAFIDGHYKIKSRYILAEILLLRIIGNCDWIAICLMGALVASLYENKTVKKLFSSKIIKALALIAIFLLIKRPEGIHTFYIDGICSALLLAVIYYSETMQNISGKCKISQSLGKYTMTIFMIHNGVYSIIGEKLFNLQIYSKTDYCVSFIVNFILCFMVILVISIPLQKLINYLMSIAKGIRLYG